MRGYLRALGPGLVTGASDDDPSGIATYAQAGSSFGFGFGFLWTALLTFPLMAAVQEICDPCKPGPGANTDCRRRVVRPCSKPEPVFRVGGPRVSAGRLVLYDGLSAR